MAPRIPRWRPSTLLCALLAVIVPVSALSNAYCSPQNTDSSGVLALQSIYMTMGLCHDQCKDSFAFAIVQADQCWCSDYIPAEQVSTSQCNFQCPGFPDDLCGNPTQGLYGYVKLSKAAAGTAGASSSPATTSQASPSGSPTQSEVKSVQTVTAGGSTVIQVVTIQQTPTVTGTMAPGNLPTQQKDSGGISGGLIAAAVVASVLGVALIAALVWFFLRKRRQNEESNEKYGDINDDPSSPSNLNRNISTHSKAGLLERGYPPTVATRMSRVSSTNGPEMSSSDAVSPVTPNSERRHSNMIVYDSRLNPNALMVIDNGSHTSLNTLDDHRDYGRMLKITNPDSNRPSMSRGRSFE